MRVRARVTREKKMAALALAEAVQRRRRVTVSNERRLPVAAPLVSSLPLCRLGGSVLSLGYNKPTQYPDRICVDSLSLWGHAVVFPSHSRRRLCCGGTGSPPNSVLGLPHSQVLGFPLEERDVGLY